MNKRQRKKFNKKLVLKRIISKIQKAIYDYLKDDPRIPSAPEYIEGLSRVIHGTLIPAIEFEVEEMASGDRSKRVAPKVTFSFPLSMGVPFR